MTIIGFEVNLLSVNHIERNFNTVLFKLFIRKKLVQNSENGIKFQESKV